MHSQQQRQQALQGGSSRRRARSAAPAGARTTLQSGAGTGTGTGKRTHNANANEVAAAAAGAGGRSTGDGKRSRSVWESPVDRIRDDAAARFSRGAAFVVSTRHRERPLEVHDTTVSPLPGGKEALITFDGSIAGVRPATFVDALFGRLHRFGGMQVSIRNL
jgi:hypothetical protein